MKGLSLQSQFPIGGLFQSAANYDPFEEAGVLRASLDPTTLTAPADAPTVITNVNISNVANILVHTPTKLYEYLRNSPYTRSDVTASIDIDPTALVGGAIMWKGRYIYAHPEKVWSWNLGASNVAVLNAGNLNLNIRKFCIAGDGNLYSANYGGVDKYILESGTTGNVANQFAIDTGFTVRDLMWDGNYLVILADNNAINTASRVSGSYSCKVYFWDLSTTVSVPNQTWNIPGESYLIGGVYQDGAVHVFGANGLYVCNFSTPPKTLIDKRTSAINKWPTNPYQITQSPHAIYWCNGETSGTGIYGYGSFPGQKNKIFYQPYLSPISATYAHSAIAYSDGAIVTGSNEPKLYLHNVGSTRGSLTVVNAPVVLDQPYTFSHIKVSLKKALTTGQGVTVRALNMNGDVISDTDTQSYAAAKPRKNLLFRYKAGTNTNPKFEDISLSVTPLAGAEITRVSLYATPLSDGEADL
ncbi:MAG: hypothetical protein ACLGJB_03700 [Blastocatellia bacterium]